MRKALSLYLPMWPVDLARRREARVSSPGATARACATSPEQRETAASAFDVPPVLFVTMVANQQRVAACCERALGAGVRPGMTLAHARALLPVDSARVLEHRPERDSAALRSLAEWMTRLAPVVACDPPDGLLMDLSGCERLYRSDAQMVRLVARACTQLGLGGGGGARVAIGPTLGSAWAMARYGPARLSLIKPGRVREALAPLPVEALRIDQETVAALGEIGIERIGQLLDVARSTLPSRFGDALLLRLDQAVGEAMWGGEVIEPVRPAPPPQAHMAFAGPTTQRESIEEAARRLLENLCAQLAKLERGVRRLDVTLERIDADHVALTVSLSHPNRNVRHLWAMLAPKLERANLGFGVEGVRLVATKTGRLRHTQAECWRDEDAAARAAAERAKRELIDTLVGRLGGDRVVWLEARQTHIPERVFRKRSVVGGEGAEPRSRAATEGEGAAAGSDRPTMLFARPEPVQVLAIAPEGPPKWLAWRGQEHTLISAIGPERIVEEWWWNAGFQPASWNAGFQPASPERKRSADKKTKRRKKSAEAQSDGWEGPPARDYFKVQTAEGRWLWLFRRAPSGRWSVHGEWA